MADLGDGTATEDFRGAIDRVLDAGLEVDEIARVVAERAALSDESPDDISTDTDNGSIAKFSVPPGVLLHAFDFLVRYGKPIGIVC